MPYMHENLIDQWLYLLLQYLTYDVFAKRNCEFKNGHVHAGLAYGGFHNSKGNKNNYKMFWECTPYLNLA